MKSVTDCVHVTACENAVTCSVCAVVLLQVVELELLCSQGDSRITSVSGWENNEWNDPQWVSDDGLK